MIRTKTISKIERTMSKVISIKNLTKWGFEKVGEDDYYEFKIKQYGGYSDFVCFHYEKRRLIVQYRLNQIELYDCDYEKANKALSLCGLPAIDKLQKE